ncbi:unnamed protein product [Thelazia callipaeda]|uniref:Protein FAM136A n=1 Tax=Thelazia callipaeda TaxID=103827 RepID=A0A0N5CYG9_THECL|nr:unnamed protein product [Thelazia callipaeda]
MKRLYDTVLCLNSVLEISYFSYLRKAHQQMFICISNCYSQDYSREIVETCMQRCNQPVKKLNTILQQELGQLQARLHYYGSTLLRIFKPDLLIGRFDRCSMTCLDKASQKHDLDITQVSQVENRELKEEISKCTSVCVDDLIKLLPKVRKRFADSFQRHIGL